MSAIYDDYDLNESMNDSVATEEEIKKLRKKRITWSSASEAILIRLWKKRYGALRSLQNNAHLYEEIRRIMNAKGYPVSIVEIKTKLENLQKKYKYEKAKIELHGPAATSWQHYKYVKSILGDFNLNYVEGKGDYEKDSQYGHHPIIPKSYQYLPLNSQLQHLRNPLPRSQNGVLDEQSSEDESTNSNAFYTKLVEDAYNDCEMERKNRKRKKRVTWSKASEGVLIKNWLKQVQALDVPSKNVLNYKEMAQALNRSGFSFSVVEIKTKLENLQKKHKTEKAKMDSSCKFSTYWEHYPQVNQIISYILETPDGNKTTNNNLPKQPKHFVAIENVNESEQQKVTITNNHSTCRTCGKNLLHEDAFNIFNGKHCTIREQIELITGVLLPNTVGFPTYICLTCQIKLTQAISFRECCIATQKMYLTQLTGVFDNPKELSKNDTTRSSIFSEHHNESVVDDPLEILYNVKQELNDINDNEVSEQFNNNTNVDEDVVNYNEMLLAKEEIALEREKSLHEQNQMLLDTEVPEQLNNNTNVDEDVVNYNEMQLAKEEIALEREKAINEQNQNMLDSLSDYPELSDELTMLERYQIQNELDTEQLETLEHESDLEQLQASQNESDDELIQPMHRKATFKKKPSTGKQRPKGKERKLRMCDECGKSFVGNRSLAIHKLGHEGIKAFECEHCKQRFYTAAYLKVHMRKHVNPLKCIYCDKEFAYSSSKARHERIHRNERPYQCHYCETKFMTSNDRSVHETKHTQIRNFQCKVCDLWFLSKKNLRQHYRSRAHKQKESMEQ